MSMFCSTGIVRAKSVRGEIGIASYTLCALFPNKWRTSGKLVECTCEYAEGERGYLLRGGGVLSMAEFRTELYGTELGCEVFEEG